MGVERTLAAINGLPTVHAVDTVRPVLDALQGSSSGRDDERFVRVVADHVRAAYAIVADGVEPSNRDRGYVVRRLIRRATLHARRMGLRADWCSAAGDAVCAALGRRYPELESERERIARVLGEEIGRFERTLERGLREIDKRRVLDGAAAFDLYQTYGFPWELTRELSEARGQPLDACEFEREFERHRELSRTASAGSFAGGLADHSWEIVRYHTVTHLLNAALRRVLGEHVMQKGSNITRERIRFDFSHPSRLSSDQKSEVERLVNAWIAGDLAVVRREMSQSVARALGAVGAFGEKYGERVSVYSIVDEASGAVVSREFCGGPHALRTSEIAGHFAIVRDEALGANVRRIKAVVRS